MIDHLTPFVFIEYLLWETSNTADINCSKHDTPEADRFAAEGNITTPRPAFVRLLLAMTGRAVIQPSGTVVITT